MNSFFSHIFSPSRHDFIQGQESIHESIERCAAVTAGLGDDLTEAKRKLLQRIDEVAALCDRSGEERDAAIARLKEQSEAINQILDTVRGYLEDKPDYLSRLNGMTGILLALNAKEYPLDVRFEREYYKGFPYGAEAGDSDFKEDLLDLLRGLDQKSIQTVILQMRRLRAIITSDDPYISFYNTEEKEMMRSIAEGLYSNILKLSDDCYLFHPYLLPINHFEPGVFVEKLMLPELTHPERLADKDIIDAGAFIGDSALILSPYTSKKVYAFEPTPGNYELLLKTIEMNALTNVVPCSFALGEQEGVTSISPSGSASTQFENTAFHYGEKSEVPVTTLDGFVKEHDLRVGLIKADIEGAESLMLKGAEKTLRTQRPALLISIYHNAHDYFKIKPWLEGLDLGYKFKIRHSTGGTVLTETILIAEVS